MQLGSIRREADVVVVGSGPGGATVARELSRAGKKVLLLERGRDHRGKWYYGTYLGALLYTDRGGLLLTEEGLNIVRPLLLGGATSMFCGCAAKPPPWLKTKYGIDLDRETQATIEELGIAPLPQELRGRASTRIAEAARSLGFVWEPIPKFMSPGKSNRFDCGAKCMLGCRCGAKWSAAQFVDQAVASGGEVMTRALVDEVTIEGGVATGVRGWAKRNGARCKLEVQAKVVVLCAGGVGTPLILQNTGFTEAGRGMTMDTTVMVYGRWRERGIGKEPPMTWGYTDDEVGYMLSTLIDPWLLYPIIMTMKGPTFGLTWGRWGNTLGVMIKLKDDVSGGISVDGRISKPMTDADRYKLNHAAIAARRILTRAGCDPDSIMLTPLRGTHPSGTVRIGEMLTKDLEMEVANLFVCDASCFPEALDRPTVLTIIALGRRLARHLLGGALA